MVKRLDNMIAVDKQRVNIGYALPAGVGLRTLMAVGSIERELALLRFFVRLGWNVTLFSYDRWPIVLKSKNGIRVSPQWPFILPGRLTDLYDALMPWVRRGVGRRCDVIVTNQANGGLGIARATAKWQKTLIGRCGYVYGRTARMLGMSGKEVEKRISWEREVLLRAARCVVTTEELRHWVCTEYGLDWKRVEVIPNHVDTKGFAPQPSAPTEWDVICIDRLVRLKGHAMLLRALKRSSLRVLFIGDGPEKNTLLSLAKQLNISLTLIPSVTHSELPKYLNRSRVFVKTSRIEGHPKSLIEAMSCGRPCLGVNVPGVANIIKAGENGMLVERTPEALRPAIQELLDDPSLAGRLGEAARRTAISTWSEAVVFERYRQMILEVIGDTQRAKWTGGP